MGKGSAVGLKLIVWFCTDSTGEKGKNWMKSFSNVPTTIASQNSEKNHVQYVKKTHVQRLLTRDYSVSISEYRVSLLRFCDHGLVRIVRDLTLKNILAPNFTSNDIFIIILAAVSERHRLGILLIPPLVHVHRFLVYLGDIYEILDSSF